MLWAASTTGRGRSKAASTPAVFLYHSVYISGGICQAAVSIAEFGGDEDRVPWAQSVRQRGILQSGEQNVGTGQNEKGDRPDARAGYLEAPAVYGNHFSSMAGTSR